MATHDLPVVDGPDIDALFHSLKTHSIAEFWWIRPDDERDRMKAYIGSISVKPGKRGWWLVTGYEPGAEGESSFSIEYQTKSRTGTVRFCVGGPRDF